MIKLIKSTFFEEQKTKKLLCDFIANSSKLSMGDKCKEFEVEFAKYQGRDYATFFNSGSSANLALIQAVINLEYLNKEDYVGFSALTWATNPMPIIQLGLNGLPIDVSMSNLNVDSEGLVSAIADKNIKALFLTNLLGFSGDLEEIVNICKTNDITLLEDNCEALGSEINGKKLGNYGLASTFSFFVGHHLSTIEGGMVCTDDKALNDMLVMVRAHGWSRNLDLQTQKTMMENNSIDDFYNQYSFYFPGYNLRPTEINGFIGVEQLQYMDTITKKRNENFLMFNDLANKNSDFHQLDAKHLSLVSNFAYPLICSDKETTEAYRKKFSNSDVEIRPIVGGAITEQPFFKKILKNKNTVYSCDNAKKIHECGFYFPNNPEMTDEEKGIICSLLKP